jgi:hypothetical protein
VSSACPSKAAAVCFATSVSTSEAIFPIPVTVSDRKRNPTIAFPIKFHLPPASSSSDSSSENSTASIFPSPIFEVKTCIALHQEVTPTYQLEQLYTTTIYTKSDSRHSTP